MVLDDFLQALALVFSGNADVWQIILLSFLVSGTAVLISTVLGVPLGVKLGKTRVRSALLLGVLNTGVGLPPVLIGLFVYLLFYSRGVLSVFDVLFTPVAMLIAQVLLTLPIIIAVTRATIADLPEELPNVLLSLGAAPDQVDHYLWREARQGILIGVITALGRAFSEVGAVMIVGGNIKGYTRVLTTAIVTEVSMGLHGTALALGVVLLSISGTLTVLLTRYLLRGRV